MNGFILRFTAALILVFVTFNPTGISWTHWAMTSWDNNMALISLTGLILVIGWVIYLRATLRSIGPLGILLVGALVAASIWVLVDLGVMTLGNSGAFVWISLVGLALVMGVGLSWSIIRRKLSGQVDMDDVENNG